MTLDKHKIDGVPQITVRALPTEEFDALLIQAGYRKMDRLLLKETVLKVGGLIQHLPESKRFTAQTEP